MKVLRSRKTMSAVAPKPSQPSAPENVVDEPMTPAKTSETLNLSTNSASPSLSSPTQYRGHLETGFGSGDGTIMVSECGTVRRVSARLAKKAGINEYPENADVVSAKRKKVEVASLSGEFDARNLESEAFNTKLGVACSVEVSEQIIGQQDMGDEGVRELVKEGELFKYGGSVEKSGLGYDVEASMVDIVESNRRFSKEAKGLGLECLTEDKVEKGFLNLRSGRRVGKRRMRDDGGLATNLFEGIENSKKGGRVLNGDELSESMAKAYVEDVNDHGKDERILSRGKEGKCMDGSEASLINGSAPINFMDRTLSLVNLNEDANSKEAVKDNGGIVMKQGVGASSLSPSDLNEDVIAFTKSENLKDVVEDKGDVAIDTRVKTRRRLTIEEKGKMKLGAGASSSSAIGTAEVKVEDVNESSVAGTDHTAIDEALPDRVQVRDTNVTVDNTRSAHRERFRRHARRNASRFAHFSLHDELGTHAHNAADSEVPLLKPDSGIEDWPGPFSTAMKIIKDREGNRNGKRHSASTDKSETVELKWTPKNQESCKNQKQVPSLIDLCLSVISKNADAVTSLDFIPDALRHKICCFLCDSRRMDCHFLELLVHGTPTEIRVRDCSWLSEELFTKTFKDCNASKLMVLQFDLCGSCMPDCALQAALAHSQNGLPALTTISLKGAYRLSDDGLRMLVSAAPSLKSVDISQCSLLTSEGVCCLASSLRLVLRELYLDYCDGIDAMLILPALQKLENLEVLSVAGIQTVCDDFVCEFLSANGHRMKELVLADCMELTDSSLKVIGDTCSDLRAIDLTNLHKLTDISIGFLANGCREIQELKLCRNAFSDEAIAAYLEVRGASLKDLALNSISQVSNYTALSLAKNCRNLRSLDLSWCRNLTNEALGLIVDSCVSLEVLKLFGCTQVSNVLIDGHSNPQVKLVGLKMSPILKDIDDPDFLVGPLRYP
ncbi:hypothetical protein ACS0TY_026823 [Phlomoides rotata]